MPTSLIEQARDSMFLDTATGLHLSRVGQNYGVSRPLFAQSDEILRGLIPVLGYSEKITTRMVEKTLLVFFGADSGVKFYEVTPNELVVTIPKDLYTFGSLSDRTYLQGDLTPPETTLQSDADRNDTALDVVDTTGFAAGLVVVDYGYSTELLIVASVGGPNTLTLSADSPVRHTKHKAGVNVRQFIVEADSSSYAGDYLGVPYIEATLGANITAGATTAVLSTPHTLPTNGVFWFTFPNPALRERFDCRIAGSVLSLTQYPGHTPAIVSQFANNHTAGETVRFYDLKSAPNVGSDVLNTDRAIYLYSDAALTALQDTLNLLTASGVVVRLVRE